MRTWVAMLYVLTAVSLLCSGLGCEEPRVYEQCVITARVVDSETAEPIDSARVYVTAYLPAPFWEEKRHLECYSDEDGEFELWYGSDPLRLFEVEKDGYLPASQTLEGSGALYFALRRAFR